MPPIEQSQLGRCLGQASAGLRAAVRKHAQEMGLAGLDLILIAMLDHLGSSRLVDLSRRLEIPHPSVLRHLDRLEELGYLERTPSPEDRRTKVVRLTKRGRAIAPQARDLLLAVERLALQGLTREEVTQLRDLLQRIAENLGRPGCELCSENTESGSKAKRGK